MALVKDLLADQTVTLSSGGYTAERSFIVTISGGTPESKLFDAMRSDGIPQYNDPHPILPEVIVTSVNARPVTGSTTDQIKVMVSYSIPEADDAEGDLDAEETIDGSVTLTTSLATEQTFFDIFGEFLTVKWLGSAIVVKYTDADVQRPQLEVTFRRIETSLPKADIIKFLGKVNSAPWSGFPAKTWLCTKIDASEEKEGRFDVDYGFSYREDSWRLEVIAGLTPEQIDELPPNTETANGYQVYDVYAGADFNQLGLSF